MVSAHRGRGDVIIHVDDEGPGVPAENLETIFERFYTSRPKGVGVRWKFRSRPGDRPPDRRGARRQDMGRESIGRRSYRRCALHRGAATGMIRHAGLLAARIDGRWRGALIEGDSGRGKSDLALRALERGLRLVADDRTRVFVSGGRLFGVAPRSLVGMIEVRGVGLVALAPLMTAEIILRVRCAARPGEVERTPEPASESMLGIEIPTIDLWPLEPSAPLKLILALRHLGVGS